MEGNVQHVVKQVSNLTARMRTIFWNGLLSSASVFRSTEVNLPNRTEVAEAIRLGYDQATARKGWDGAYNNLYSTLSFTTSDPAFSVMRRLKGKHERTE